MTEIGLIFTFFWISFLFVALVNISCMCIFKSLYATREDWEGKSCDDVFCEVTSFVCQTGEGLSDLQFKSQSSLQEKVKACQTYKTNK